MENLAIARIFSRSPISSKSRARTRSRSARTATPPRRSRTRPTAVASARRSELARRFPASARTSPRRFARSPTPANARYHRELLTQFPPTILDLLRAAGSRTEDRRHALSANSASRRSKSSRRPATTAASARSKGWAEERAVDSAAPARSASSIRGPPSAVRRQPKWPTLLVEYLRERARRVTSTRSAASGAAPKPRGDIDILATRRRPGVMSTFTRLHAGRACARPGRDEVERPALGAASRPICGSSRPTAVAPPCSTSPDRSRTTSRCAIARSSRGFKLNEYGLFRADDGSLVAGRTEADIYEALGLGRSSPRSFARIAARSKRPSDGALPTLITLEDIQGDMHTHTTETDGREDIETMAMAAREPRPEIHGDHRSQQVARDGQRARRAPRDRSMRGASGTIGERLEGITLLAGIECDIRHGRLDGSRRRLPGGARHRRRVRALRVQPGRSAR